MPIYEYICQCGLIEDHYLGSYTEAKDTFFRCPSCRSPMHFQEVCGGRGALYFEEGRARTIWNLGDQPVTVTSAREHRDAMKKAGVVEGGGRRGEKGSWL